jgi:hypothetical protein
MAQATTNDPRTYPFECELCGCMIESADDAMWWHGYGNCVEITDAMWEQWRKEAEAEAEAEAGEGSGK